MAVNSSADRLSYHKGAQEGQIRRRPSHQYSPR